MDLKKYVNEMIDIAEANHMAWDIGLDMFMANIRNCGEEDAPHYAGAFVDYPALKLQLEDMTPKQVSEMKNDFAYWYRAHMDEIIRARKGE